MKKEGFGTDLGGVVAAHATLEILEQGGHLAVPEIDESFDSIGQLREERFGDNTFVISMCDERIEVKSREWIEHTRFLERTALSWNQIIYCRTFAEKARIAGRLGINHFVDDRLEVLGGFNRKEKLYLFQPNKQERDRFSQHLDKELLDTILEVQSWREIVADILEGKTHKE